MKAIILNNKNKKEMINLKYDVIYCGGFFLYNRDNTHFLNFDFYHRNDKNSLITQTILR